MPSTRQDAWTPNEDIVLAEIVLRHIREGSTQLKAFEEVGVELTRTAAACGFRWNSYVRKQYQTGIELAKKQRKQMNRQPVEKKQLVNDVQQKMNVAHTFQNDGNKAITFKEVIEYLENLFEASQSHSTSKIKELQMAKITALETEVIELETENNRLVKDLSEMEEAYEALIDLMEQARKVVVHHGEDR